jgi:quercetin 2,3-dioxygenase
MATKENPMKISLNSSTRSLITWVVAGLMAGPVTAAVVWLASATGFVVLPADAPKFAGAKGREHDFTELLATADRTGGSLGVFRQTIAPHSGPPAHMHHGADEFIYIESGTFKVKLGDQVIDAPAKSFVFVPRDTAHTFTNAGTEPGTLLVGVTPGGFEKLFEERQGVDKQAEAQLFKNHNTEIVGPPLK